jgi:hypothetical protein
LTILLSVKSATLISDECFIFSESLGCKLIETFGNFKKLGQTFMNMMGNDGEIVSMGTGLQQSVSNAEISTKDFVLCSFKLEKEPAFRISPVLEDLEENFHFKMSLILSFFLWYINIRKFLSSFPLHFYFEFSNCLLI